MVQQTCLSHHPRRKTVINLKMKQLSFGSIQLFHILLPESKTGSGRWGLCCTLVKDKGTDLTVYITEWLHLLSELSLNTEKTNVLHRNNSNYRCWILQLAIFCGWLLQQSWPQDMMIPLSASVLGEYLASYHMGAVLKQELWNPGVSNTRLKKIYKTLCTLWNLFHNCLKFNTELLEMLKEFTTDI